MIRWEWLERPPAAGALRACGFELLPPLFPLLLFALLLLLALLLLREVMADDTPSRRAQHRVMPRDMSRHGAYGGTLDAA